jgi:hypothetical protein
LKELRIKILWSNKKISRTKDKGYSKESQIRGLTMVLLNILLNGRICLKKLVIGYPPQA